MQSTRLLLVPTSIILFALALAVAVGQKSWLDRVGELPWTEHATKSHADQLFSAWTIVPMLERRACQPVEAWACPTVAQIRLTCPVAPGSDLWAGLIIGWRTGRFQIVDAYAARSSYWMKAMVDDKCFKTWVAP